MTYRLTRAADADIEQIGRYSAEQWGFEQAEAYVLSLHQTFEQLADFPSTGRDASDVRPGMFRLEHESHVVFYRQEPDGVLVVRVLHQRMMPRKHF